MILRLRATGNELSGLWRSVCGFDVDREIDVRFRAITSEAPMAAMG